MEEKEDLLVRRGEMSSRGDFQAAEKLLHLEQRLREVSEVKGRCAASSVPRSASVRGDCCLEVDTERSLGLSGADSGLSRSSWRRTCTP